MGSEALNQTEMLEMHHTFYQSSLRNQKLFQIYSPGTNLSCMDMCKSSALIPFFHIPSQNIDPSSSAVGNHLGDPYTETTKQSTGSPQFHVMKCKGQRNFSKSVKSNSYSQFWLKTDFIAAKFITCSHLVY